MNKQGQVNINLGLLISVAVAVIVGAVLLIGVSSYVEQTRATYVHNDSLGTCTTTPSAGESIDLVGQDVMADSVIVINCSGDNIAVPTTNYTISEVVSTTTGVKTISYTSIGTGTYNDSLVNISYTYGAEGYIDDSGGRAVAQLIIVFMALLIGTVALVPVLRNKILDLAGI